MSVDGDLRSYAEFLTLLGNAGVESGPLCDELILWSWGFEPRDVGGGDELFEDPLDPSDRGGLWVGKPEALRRVAVRARQGRTPPFAGGCP